MKIIYYFIIISCSCVFISCYSTTPKYLFAPNSANLLQIEKKGDVKAATNYAQSKHVGNNDESPGIQTSNGIDVQTAYSPINHLVLKIDLFKKWEVDKAVNNDQTNSSRYKINYQRQGTVLSIGYYKYLDQAKEILFNIDGGIGLGKTSFNGTYRNDAITKYVYSANNVTVSVTPSIRFKVSKNYNLTLAYRLSSVDFSKITTNDSTLTKGLYEAFANKNSIYGDIMIENNFGFNSLQGIRFHWQLGISKLYTHFNYNPSPGSQSFPDQYEYNNSFGSFGIVADLKKIFKSNSYLFKTSFMASINISNKERLSYFKNTKFVFLTILFIATWFYFFYSAIDVKDWWMENILVIIFCVMLFVSQKKFIFSNTSLAFIFLFLLLHVYGARMAYTHNEMGEFLRQTFKLSRNPYDRIVHFSFGFLMTYPLHDYFTYKYSLSKKHLVLTVNMIILCLATIFELIEWGVAAFTDSATGETYVATQGDPWDAQKDIILASIGSAIFFGIFNAVTSVSVKKTKTNDQLIVL